MKLYFYLLLFLLLTLFSCQPPSPPTLNGTWQSVGSGWLLHIQDSTKYAFYDLTSISCLPNRKRALDELTSSLTLENDTLSLHKGVITYKFTSTPSLPTICTETVSERQQNDPIYNFEVFAETVSKHYAFMQLNEIDWPKLYVQQKAKLSPNSTEAELYLVIEETLEILKDNHAYLEADEEVYEMLEEMEESTSEEEVTTLPEYGDFQVAAMVAKHHLQEELTRDSWLIQWGKMKDDIGYIQVKAMWLYADLDIPKSLIEEVGYVDAYIETFHQMYEGDYIEQEVEGVRSIMDTVMQDLAQMQALVIDVRFNGGGQDAVSYEILSRFIPAQTQIATQKLYYENQFTPTLPLYIEGKKNAYAQPVYVLTSPQTGSAAESFSIATLSIPHIQRIGSATSGAMSTALEKTLPNGWSFAISNEIYMDNQGKCYENQGIPVDHELSYPRTRQPFFRSVADDLAGDQAAIMAIIQP
ncbi:MAG: S41 family peptidase [Bacteroidota bacterium]